MTTLAPDDDLAVAEWNMWTTTARLVVTDPGALGSATTIVETYLEQVDLAASRFRPDSEVSVLAASAEERHAISPLLSMLVTAGLEAASATGGALDPTLGTVLADLGYGLGGLDHDSSLSSPPPPMTRTGRAPSWRDVLVDGLVLRLPPRTLLDLGATAKAYAADHCAVTIADELGCGVLVALGGDLRVAGAEPACGWNILVKDGADEPESQIRLSGAEAIATSSTLHRAWQRDGQRMHHVIDPRTRMPAPPYWRTASVAAATCLRANTLTTYALIEGEGAIEMLEQHDAPARLVDAAGRVHLVGGWPS